MGNTRALAGVGILFSIVTAILATIIVMAGVNKNMTQFEIVSINTSRIGSDILKNLNPLSRRGILDDITDKGKDLGNDIKGGINDAKNGLNSALTNALNNLQGSIADALGLDDFYNLYVLDHCSGDFSDPTAKNATFKIKECSQRSDNSNSSAPGGLDIGSTIQSKVDGAGLPSSITDKLKIPDSFQDTLDTVTLLFKIATNLGWVTIALSALTVLLGIASIALNGRKMTAGLSMFSGFLAGLVVVIWSIMLLVFMTKASSIMNDKLAFLNVVTTAGMKMKILLGSMLATSLLAGLSLTCGYFAYRNQVRYARQY